VIHDIASNSCPWSLSGPQFPQPTAIQQRYCYPKGDPEYSSRKGGALWTMYGADGKENIDYRLLHVYFSAKRAINKGMTASTPKRAKKYARKSLPTSLPVSPFDRKQRTALSSLPSPTVSPMLSPNISPMPSPNISPMPFRSNFVSPFDDDTFHPMPDSPFLPRILSSESWDDKHSHHHSINLDPFHFELDTTSMQELEDTFPAKLPVLPLDMKQTPHPTLSSPTITPMLFSSSFVSPFDDNILLDSPFCPHILATESHDDEHSHQQYITLDPFHFDLETPGMQYLEDACWSDPLFGGCLLE
jgi:hypothetical protein